MKPCLLGVLSVFYLTAASLAAETFTGNDLHELCVSSNEKGDLACTSWITGFKAGLAAAQAMAEEKRPSPLCLPKQVTGDQARLIIVKFMKDFPNTLHHSASVVAFSALRLPSLAPRIQIRNIPAKICKAYTLEFLPKFVEGYCARA